MVYTNPLSGSLSRDSRIDRGMIRRTIPPAGFADLPSERKTLRRRDGC
jgi:hypothetical protein